LILWVYEGAHKLEDTPFTMNIHKYLANIGDDMVVPFTSQICDFLASQHYRNITNIGATAAPP